MNDKVKVLKDILCKETETSEDCREIPKQLDALSGLLKNNYKNHLSMDDEDGYHHLNHGFLKGDFTKTQAPLEMRSK